MWSSLTATPDRSVCVSVHVRVCACMCVSVRVVRVCPSGLGGVCGMRVCEQGSTVEGHELRPQMR